MRILFFGDGAWATDSLKALISEGHELLGLVIRKAPTDLSLLKLGEEKNIRIFQPEKVNDQGFIEQVNSLAPEINLSVSYDQIFKSDIIQTAAVAFVNFHAGQLPFYRGRNVINWAIINGETTIGLTAHFIDSGIDTGAIILQRILPLDWTDTYGDVLQKVVGAFPSLVSDTVRAFMEGQVSGAIQSSELGTYFPSRKEGDEWLDWSDTSRNLYNKIRGISHPGPGAQTLHGSQLVRIWRASYDPSWPSYLATPGQVVNRCAEKGVTVKTGDSTIILHEVQVNGQPSSMPVWPLGTRLGVDVLSHLYQMQYRLEGS